MKKSETYCPKFNLTTTPHSGTRYVRDSFIDAGWKTTTQRATRYHIDLPSDFIWGHCERGHPTWMQTVHEQWPDIRDLLVVRDPLYTLVTHWHVQSVTTVKSQRALESPVHTHALRQIGNNLDMYRRHQEDYIDLYGPHIHKVEDPIEQLGDWADIELKDGSERWSHSYDLKTAVDDRDLDRIFDIIKYSDLMEWFVTEHSANLAPLYRDQWGYDFWWYNG